ncbi:MAG: hypothetical protein QM736_00330 [Vicinamibacterales bacterium]
MYVDRLRGRKARGNIGSRPDVDDVGAVDGDGSGRNHLARRVLCENGSTGDDERDRASCALRGRHDRRGDEREDDRELCTHTGEIV